MTRRKRRKKYTGPACLTPSCTRQPISGLRGLCSTCRKLCRAAILEGRFTEDEAVQRGLMKPRYAYFAERNRREPFLEQLQ